MGHSTYYRYEDKTFSAGVDEFDNSLGPGQVRVMLLEFKVLKETPMGVWINIWGLKKFVLKSARKRFACPTKEEARQSFIARKERQLSILTAQCAKVRQALRAIPHESNENRDVPTFPHS